MIAFLVPGKKMQFVCDIPHRKGTVCNLHHEVPPNAIWSGECEWDTRGDLACDAAWQRKCHRKNLAKWKRTRKSLMSLRPAPKYRALVKQMIADHEASKPVFVFKPKGY